MRFEGKKIKKRTVLLKLNDNLKNIRKILENHY